MDRGRRSIMRWLAAHGWYVSILLSWLWVPFAVKAHKCQKVALEQIERAELAMGFATWLISRLSDNPTHSAREILYGMRARRPDA